MSVSPRPTEPEAPSWEVAGERPLRRGTPPSSDRGAVLLVVGVLLAVAVALALLFLL